MNNVNDLLHSPEGLKSYLPDKAEVFFHLKERIEEIFKTWGYRPIITPMLEYYDSLLLGMEQKTKKDFYKIIDYEGNILALRPEMTAPIARTVSNRMEELNLPVRLSYYAPVFRYDSPQMGKNREIFQLGVEFIGKNSFADIEIIILLIEALKNTGLKGFKIDLSHTKYIEGILDNKEINENIKAEIKNYLIQRNYVALKNYLASNALDTDLFLKRGGIEIITDVEKKVNNESSLLALKELRTVYENVKEYGLEDYISFDLGLIRGLGYYTGLIFEGFTNNLGYTICGGGRYDNLVEKYSARKVPAVGFAIGLERVRLALEKKELEFINNKNKIKLLFSREGKKRLFKFLSNIQDLNLIFEIDENKFIDKKLIDNYRKQRFNKMILFKDKEIELFDLASEKRFTLYNQEELINKL